MKKIIIYIFILIFPITVYAKLEDNNFIDMKLDEYNDYNDSHVTKEEFNKYILYIRNGNLTVYNKETSKVVHKEDPGISRSEFVQRYDKYNIFLYKGKCILTDNDLKEIYSTEIGTVLSQEETDKYIFLMGENKILIFNKEDSKKPHVLTHNMKYKIEWYSIYIDEKTQEIIIDANTEKNETIKLIINNKLEIKEYDLGKSEFLKMISTSNADYVLTGESTDFFISKYVDNKLIKKVKMSRKKDVHPTYEKWIYTSDIILYKGKIYANQVAIDQNRITFNTLNLFDENLNELLVNGDGTLLPNGQYCSYFGDYFVVENDKLYVTESKRKTISEINPDTLEAVLVPTNNKNINYVKPVSITNLLEKDEDFVESIKLSEDRIRILCYNKTEKATYVREYNKKGEKIFERKLKGNVNTSGDFYGDYFNSITKDNYTIDMYILNGTLYVDSYKGLEVINSYEKEYGLYNRDCDLFIEEMSFKKNGFYIILTRNYISEPKNANRELSEYNYTTLDFTFNYEVKDKSEEQGFVNISNPNAIFGEIVTLSPTIREGYEVGEIIVLDNEGNKIEVKDNQFTMPASNVEVKVSYKKSTPNPETGDYIALITLLLLVSGYIGIKHYKKISY